MSLCFNGQPHQIIKHGYPNGYISWRCTNCGYTSGPSPVNPILILAGNWKQYRAYLFEDGEDPRTTTKYIYGTHGNVAGCHFSQIIIVGTFLTEAENPQKILDYAKVLLDPGGDIRYASNAVKLGDAMFFNGKQVGKFDKDNPTGKPILLVKPSPELVRKQGDIWVLNKANAPFNSKQWAYQGSAKTPYVITHYISKKDGATTEDGWACSCMSFTRNTPRTPCKHILNVMLKENVPGVNKASAKMANVDDEKLKAFQKWEREQAAKEKHKPTSGAELKHFGATGRKFR